MKNLWVNFRQMEWESPAPGIRQKEIIIQDKKLRLIEFSEEFIEPDWCLKGHMGYIIEGSMTLDFNGTLMHYQTGDGVFIPEGDAAKHKGSIKKGEKALVFLVDKA